MSSTLINITNKIPRPSKAPEAAPKKKSDMRGISELRRVEEKLTAEINQLQSYMLQQREEALQQLRCMQLELNQSNDEIFKRDSIIKDRENQLNILISESEQDRKKYQEELSQHDQAWQREVEQVQMKSSQKITDLNHELALEEAKNAQLQRALESRGVDPLGLTAIPFSDEELQKREEDKRLFLQQLSDMNSNAQTSIETLRILQSRIQGISAMTLPT